MAACGGLLLALALVGSFSIGLLYLPAGLLLIGAARSLEDHGRDAPTGSGPAPNLNENPLP